MEQNKIDISTGHYATLCHILADSNAIVTAVETKSIP